MTDPLDWIDGALGDLEQAGLRRVIRNRDRPWSLGGMVDLSSNDYLGLARDPAMATATARGVRWGAGAGASRLVVGGSPIHVQLEQAIADWKRTEDAMVFSSGYMANLGAVQALVGRGDLVLSDALNHASIIDGCRLSGATVKVYAHRDTAGLVELLEAFHDPSRRTLIVTDGVFSMDGDTADMAALCEVAERFGAMVMVDDAHGSGVIGPEGRGTAAAQGVADGVHVHMGTLSKAVGAGGGFVAGRADLIDYLRNRARSFVFDTAMPPAVAAAALRGVTVARSDTRRRQAALDRAAQLAEGLGLPAPEACVVPLVIGQPEAAMSMSAALGDAGFLVVAIRPPSVPDGTARLRFTTNATLAPDTIDRVVAATRAALPPPLLAPSPKTDR